MPAEKNCPTCGKPLPGNTLMGLCPDCLLQAGFGTLETENGPGEKSPPFVPPAPKDLARYFPELEIMELLGQGGMGAVYKARQKRLDRLVALKILPPNVGGDPSFAARFEREAKALAQLHHPHIVTLYDSGQTDGMFYFFMEYVDGMNLRQLLGSGHVSPREALAIVPQICDALQFAHDRGIIHRDIKPENILLNQAGQVKIADFGVAKIVGRAFPESGNPNAEAPAEMGGTEAGKVIGTPQYMAPEQLSNPLEVDNRADIYALGVVFYQMLTGELPVGKFVPPSRKVQTDVRLDEVVLRALEKNPENRYQQASLFKTQVEAIAETPKNSDKAAPPRTKKTLHWILIGILVLGLILLPILVLFSFIWWRIAEVKTEQTQHFAEVQNKKAQEENRQRSSFPVYEYQTNLPGPSSLVYHDHIDTIFAFYYADTFRIDGVSPSSPQGVNEGNIRMPKGQSLTYRQVSSSPSVLKVNDQSYDLKQGRVFLLDDDGKVKQLALFPPWKESRDPKTLSKLVEKKVAEDWGNSGFGPVISTSLPIRTKNFFVAGTPAYIDFETGEILAPPNDKVTPEWIRKTGVDAEAIDYSPSPGLLGEPFGCQFAVGTSTDWETSSPETIAAKLKTASLGDFVRCSDPTYLTATYLFKTRDGSMGALKITNANRNVVVRFQYKMLKTQDPVSPSGQTTEGTPKLRYLAWQEENRGRTIAKAWLPDGQPVKDKKDLHLLEEVSATRLGFSDKTGVRRPVLQFWFSGPDLDGSSYQEVTLLDEHGQPLPLGERNSRGSGAEDPSETRGDLGWITYSLFTGENTTLPPKVAVRLQYSGGPWKILQEIPANTSGGTSLGNGAYLNGVGQGADGKAFVPIAIDQSQGKPTQYNFIAMTREGKELNASSTSSVGASGGPMLMQRFEFNLPLDQIRFFRLRTREIHSVTFQNIPLEQIPK